jgi:nitrate/nitrite transport system ATP-binding protein
MRPFVSVEELRRAYGPLVVFEGVGFTIDKGEFVCLIGHSGCGKSTILNIVAGLDRASAGQVIVDGSEVRGPSLDRGVVFQSHALLPWLSALKNVAFAVRSRWPKWSDEQVVSHAQKYLDMVHLTGSGHKKPAELSGGMKQRVGIARAFAIQPKMLLLDEPFGALDALTRGVIQDELLTICAATRQTVLMITHDVDEAVLLADRILLMSNGPRAGIAEVVENVLPRGRTRQTIHRDPRYYTLRNHLLDFLVTRSMRYRNGAGNEAARTTPPELPREESAP